MADAKVDVSPAKAPAAEVPQEVVAAPEQEAPAEEVAAPEEEEAPVAPEEEAPAAPAPAIAPPATKKAVSSLGKRLAVPVKAAAAPAVPAKAADEVRCMHA